MTLKYAVGILELVSIAKGYETLDAVLKSASVRKLLGRTICSGKYLIIFSGEIGDVESGLSAGRVTAGGFLINEALISNIDKRVFPGLAGTTVPDTEDVDGMAVLETFSVASAIKAADIAVKAADVAILRIHPAMAVGGKGYVVLTGNIDAVKSAVNPAVEFLKEEGTLAGQTVISHPHADVLKDML